MLGLVRLGIVDTKTAFLQMKGEGGGGQKNPTIPFVGLYISLSTWNLYLCRVIYIDKPMYVDYLHGVQLVILFTFATVVILPGRAAGQKDSRTHERAPLAQREIVIYLFVHTSEDPKRNNTI